MNKLVSLARNFHEDESGVALLEYTILLGIIAVAVIGIITTVGLWTVNKWSAFCGVNGINAGAFGNCS